MRVLLFLALACLSSAAVDWKVLKVDRTVDLSSQVVKVTSLATFGNVGSEANSVTFVVSEEEEKHLAYIAAQEDGSKGKLKVSKQTGAQKGFQAYKIELLKMVAKGGQVKLKIDYRVTQVLTPYPAQITQKESQFVLYEGNAHVASAYPVAEEKTTFKLASGKTISATTVSPSKQESDRVVYGPYINQPAYNGKAIKIHYENNSPFVVATVVERTIELSHWGGNIAVEEYVELVHKGALLKGSFSRLDYQMDRRGQRQPALQHFTTVLPASARDVYYRDEIGNITTSALRVRSNSIDLELRPRFPLFGGWRTSYVIGYNIPSYEYLYRKGNDYALKMRVLDHIFDNIVVEKLTTKVILPETARKIKVSTPFSMERRPDEVRATYLDTAGRPVVVLQKSNLVGEHEQMFTVSYEFEMTNMLREPLLATAFFFVLFTVVMIYVRLDFTIVADPVLEAKQRVRGKVTALASYVDQKQKLFANFMSEVAQFKSSRDEKILTEAKQTLTSKRTAVNEKLNNATSDLKADSQESFEKAQELLRYDKNVMDAVDMYLAAVQKSQQKSGTEDVTFNQKISEARNKADNILAAI